jgi:hypothetical protein
MFLSVINLIRTSSDIRCVILKVIRVFVNIIYIIASFLWGYYQKKCRTITYSYILFSFENIGQH